MSEPNFPVTFKRGDVVVKIYRTPSRGCDAFTVSYYLGDKRQRVTFADLGRAMTEAQMVATRLSNDKVNALTQARDDQLCCNRAMETLKSTGVPLEIAAAQFAEAHRLLEDCSVLDAARFYVKENLNRQSRKRVPEIVAEFIETKAADKMSAVYLKDLKSRLGRFAAEFPGAVSNVKSAEIEGFLRGLKGKDAAGQETIVLSGKSRNNYRRAIGTLFNFAEARGYLPKGFSDVKTVPIVPESHVEIEIFRPDELVNLLEAADPAIIPFLTIGAFAGLRHAELQRLDWSEVRLEDGFVEVKASRRQVPMQDNLKRWLRPLRKAGGPICDYVNMSKQLLWLSEAVDQKLKEQDPTAGFVWKHHALRHSFISYRVAQTQNMAQVAQEAGSSIRSVFSNYQNRVSPADAEKWFAIGPDQPGKRRRPEKKPDWVMW